MGVLACVKQDGKSTSVKKILSVLDTDFQVFSPQSMGKKVKHLTIVHITLSNLEVECPLSPT